jgi:hypothetical protein
VAKLIDDSICPLCQSNNQCGIDENTPCWCINATISKELISQIPTDLKDKSCICQLCITKFKGDNDLIKEIT